MSVSAEDLVSPAMACLRVAIHGTPEAQAGPDLQALVAKLINAFLDSRWRLPRRFEQMTPYAFILSDPGSEKMDKRGLKILAAELQMKLFGAEGEGEVSLLLFEGPDMEVHRFANLPIVDVERFAAGIALIPPLTGDVQRIIADRRKNVGLAKGEVVVRRRSADNIAPPKPIGSFEDLDFDEPVRPAPPLVVPAPTDYTPLFSGLYLSVSQSFIGNVVLCRKGASKRLPSLLDPTPLPGVTAEQFDEGCVEAAAWALGQAPAVMLFVPLSFSSLVRPAGRRSYARFLCHLPSEHRARLGAAIYDTPRDPSYFALTTIRRFLEPFVAEINLHISDPDFEIDKLPAGAVGSVTLGLPDQDFNVRMAAVKRFLASGDLYKKKRVWPGVGPLMTASELNLCLSLRVPVISGPAVSIPGRAPIPALRVDSGKLPVR
jgi:hypothetical protein